jgi:Nif-specific regulatory protein
MRLVDGAHPALSDLLYQLVALHESSLSDGNTLPHAVLWPASRNAYRMAIVHTPTSCRTYLQVFLGDQLIRDVLVPPTGVTIGRKLSNSLVLADPTVSSQHAELVFRGQDLVLIDRGSSGGTLIQGRPVQERTLEAEDLFEIGPFRLCIVREQAAPAGDWPVVPTVNRAPMADTTAGFLDLVRTLIDWTELIGLTDQQAVMETLLERARLVLGASGGMIFLKNQNQFAPILCTGSVQAGAQTLGRAITRAVERCREPIWVDQNSQFDGHSPTVPVVAIPFPDGDAILGLMYLEIDQVERANLPSRRALAREIGVVGGRAIRSALKQKQLLVDSQSAVWLGARGDQEAYLDRASRAPAMHAVVEMIARVAPEDVTVLLTGETGVGKEVAARTLHLLSARAAAPFVAVNCAAIPRELLESELFGHEKGAFTGATGRTAGRFELANRGTLLLDEIGELGIELQVKLLRALETRSVQPLGAVRPVGLDVRVIAATNVNLEEAMKRKEFRSDLYYRLNVVHIQLPPLRQRPEDIEGLVQGFLLAMNRRLRRKMYGVSPRALSCLNAYGWPGNVRELRNVIERACILETTDRITVASLPPEIVAASAGEHESGGVLPLAEHLRQEEIRYIRRILDQMSGNVKQAARVLGMARAALHRRLTQLGIRDRTEPDDDAHVEESERGE